MFGYRAARFRHVIAALEQVPQSFGAGKRHLRVPGEKIEETLFLRHQGPKPTQHERLVLHAMLVERMVPDRAVIKRAQLCRTREVTEIFGLTRVIMTSGVRSAC